MSLTRSRPLNQLLLRVSQILMHRSETWLYQRQQAYDLRDRNEQLYGEKISSAHAAGNHALALDLEEQRARAYQKIRVVLDRFRTGRTFDALAVSADFRELFANRIRDLIPASEILNPAKLLTELAVLIVEILPPPGESIRSIPRRPGAPSALLPH